MNTNKNTVLHPERVARLLAVAAATDSLPADVVNDAENIIELVDSGAGRAKVTTAVSALVADAWTRAAREAAAAEKPKAVKASLERLRGVADLEEKLGLAPVDEETGNEVESNTENTSENEPDIDVAAAVEAAVGSTETSADPYSNYGHVA
ncbi:hypothetical protein [Mycobacteroides abscessus]|uniref:hypothetical protein n=1 Tax=Mycobacteroides abscessus TaxID=36809 RepID=UPI00092BE86C|nr:hypothetical protein [Mycobacteroides abscessus]MBN7371116.1 hypothetical protein [Mycobacteroides abscessus subsp. abscessus]MBN7521280.1 hypothetical protein [Mycobacteroides abscessus subsp. abscessus]MDB2185148.1 hypothetical protein [Mycobacteroides abscessus subsp. abscessus]MDO3123499.1 hypothetical protein [Mycobacteroides abscessus subsp. abscessus]MDO3173310.1 hypothetical protein [Mycobacteroides abscessus subsp. abscessus]